MKLLGSGNWWAPAPMKRWYARYGFREARATPTASETRGRVPSTAR